ncbi:hypothetical protein Pst134EB_030014 [Puccinia striiformis f. sp. tritici]|nr:hypothetical protein Pst134EB_030014 [Puccinia striiformis f. sp. tritici]
MYGITLRSAKLMASPRPAVTTVQPHYQPAPAQEQPIFKDMPQPANKKTVTM